MNAPLLLEAEKTRHGQGKSKSALRRRQENAGRAGVVHTPDPREGAMQIGDRQYLVMGDGSLRRMDGRRIRHGSRPTS